MLDKIKTYGILILATFLIVLGVSMKIMYEKYESEINTLKKAKTEELKNQKDSLILQRDLSIDLQIKRYDSLLLIKENIKYIPYEKPIYVDRTLDDAISVLTDYTYGDSKKAD